MSDAIVELRGVTKDYGSEMVTRVLHGIDLEIRPGEFAAIRGPSGSGKSTLLNILGLLDRASSGELRVRGVDVMALSDAELTRIRGRSIGFVFQFHHLLPALSAVENVMMPLALATGRATGAAARRARELLELVGLGHRADAKPSGMSGGEQQRAAIARALVHEPTLVLADEPTGNLDTHRASEVIALLRSIHEERGTSFVIVTHDTAIAERCARRIEIVDGRVAADSGHGI